MYCEKHPRAPHGIKTYGVGYCLACFMETEAELMRATIKRLEAEAVLLRVEIARLEGELVNTQYRAVDAVEAAWRVRPGDEAFLRTRDRT